jgi:DNA polymerase III sliding clamp (beta) subunit (PCNA family)
MLEELKFVQGAVAKKDFVPALTHFVIEGGKVRGYNGTLALCSPIPFNIACKPKAEPLVRAIANCTETVQLALTAAGRLSIKSGKFKAFVDCLPEGVSPHVEPEGFNVAMDGKAFLQALKVLNPFIGDDASRPWSNGVLLLGQSAFATNNVTLVEYWLGCNLPHPINIPKVAIRELLRLNEPPETVQLTETSISFHFSKERWLRTQLLETDWPDLEKVLNRASQPKPIDAKIFEAIKNLKPFVDKSGRVIFRGDGRISTHNDETEGATYEVESLLEKGIYNIDMLALLEGSCATVDWSAYPGPCMFFGHRLRGAIIGLRQ